MIEKIFKKFFAISVVILSLVAADQVFAGENINNFTVVANINQDSSVNIEETVEYDFGTDIKHGIYRDIPVRYDRNGGKYTVKISDIKVVNSIGEKWQFSTSNVDRNLRIKIGDPEKTITGVQVYKISYRIEKAINYFNDHDEFYWNATGNGWPLPITQVKLTVNFPEGVDETALKTDCFAGPYGSTNECLSERYEFQGKGIVSGVVFITESLNPAEGMTAVVGLPKKTIYEPSQWLKIISIIEDNLGLLLPVIVLAVLLYLWRIKGRDPEGRGTIIAQYDVPDDLTPLEVGTLIDEKADNQDISADIIHLAIKGYIKINRLEEKKLIGKSVDYLLEKKKDNSGLANDFEIKLMNSLFEGDKKEVKMSDLKDKFFKDLAEIKKMAYKAVTSKGYFGKNPETVRAYYSGIGVFIAVIGGIFWSPLGAFVGYLGLGVIISGILIVIFSRLMPSRTVKGKETTEYLLGLKKYLSVAEKDRLEFHNAPEKNPEKFEKLLPFAMVFKVEEKWAKQFEDIYRNQPDWYNDPSGQAFNSMLLASTMTNFASAANSTLSSAPSSAGSGGSGFSGGGSGGGFGGGGGGSW